VEHYEVARGGPPQLANDRTALSERATVPPAAGTRPYLSSVMAWVGETSAPPLHGEMRVAVARASRGLERYSDGRLHGIVALG
jgi:hypothetical protein